MATIIAPHPDDEIIGCYTHIAARRIETVAYFAPVNQERRAEAKKFCRDHDLSIVFLDGQLYDLIRLIVMEKQSIYVPSPSDQHPDHRLIFEVARHLRPGSLTMYSTRMVDPWVVTLSELVAVAKRQMLDRYYTSQKLLWLNDAKYYLFEGIARTLLEDASANIHD